MDTTWGIGSEKLFLLGIGKRRNRDKEWIKKCLKGYIYAMSHYEGRWTDKQREELISFARELLKKHEEV